MKPDIHPEYRPVVFRDQGAGVSFVIRSTITTTRTIEWEDGRTLPLHDVDISNVSHPFFTAKMKIVDTAGRVERFERRYGARGGSSPS
jgi:large subunit ribosomal protein L31